MLSMRRDALVQGLFSKGYFHPWSKIVRRAAWPLHLRFPEGRVFEELAVYARLTLALHSFIHVPEVWITYRQHSGSILNTPSMHKLDNWMSALAGFGALVRQSDPCIGAAAQFIVARFATSEWRMGVQALHNLPASGDAAPTLRKFHDWWQASTPLDARALTLQFLRRGQVRRWLQMCRLIATLDAEALELQRPARRLRQLGLE